MESKDVWDKVYTKTSPSKLPWTGIPFLKYLNKFIKKLDKSELLIVTGCGVGDTVYQLHKKGFTNLIGTDISSRAISIAKERFPELNFLCLGTEELYKKYKNVNVIEWLNLHQISPEKLPHYLSSLNRISNFLFLSYFYDSDRLPFQKSIITGELVYNHKPESITIFLSNMQKIDEFVFYTEANKEFGVLENKFRTVAQAYKKR